MRLEMRRRNAAGLLAEGVTPAEVARRLGVTRAALSQWKRRWLRGGAAALQRIPHRGRPPRLPAGAAERLRVVRAPDAFRIGFSVDLSTSPRCLRFVEMVWGVHYSRSGMWRYLRRQGLSARRRLNYPVERLGPLATSAPPTEAVPWVLAARGGMRPSIQRDARPKARPVGPLRDPVK